MKITGKQFKHILVSFSIITTLLFTQGLHAADGLTELPGELQSLILSYLNTKDLSKVLMVCKSLNPLGQRALFNGLQERGPLNVPANLLSKLIPYKDVVRRIRLSGNDVTDDTIKLLAQFPNLAELELYKVNSISKECLQNLYQYCPHLTSLSIICPPLASLSVIGYPHYLTEELINVITERLTKLTELDLGWKPYDLANVLRKCEYLCPLAQRAVLNKLQEKGPLSITSEVLSQLVSYKDVIERNWEVIRRIKLSGNNITDDTIKLLAQFPNLAELELYKVNSISKECLQNLYQYCPHLTFLSLSECPDLGITDELINGITQKLPGLTGLDLRGYGYEITNQGLENICQNCPNLNTLGLLGSKFDDTSLEIIGTRYPSLTVLYLLDGNITNEGLQNLPQDLRILDLSGCSSINGKCIPFLPKGLIELNLSYSGITKTDVEELKEKFPNMKLVANPIK